MQKFLKKYSLHLALALPLILLFSVILATIIPASFIQPKHNFVYAYYNNNSGIYIDINQSYKVIDKKIVQTENEILADITQMDIKTIKSALEQVQFFKYDTETNTNIKITYEEVAKLSIIDEKTSPDGYTLKTQQSYVQFPLFFVYGMENNTGTGYITKGAFSKRVDLLGSPNGQNWYDYYNFKFFGWITE